MRRKGILCGVALTHVAGLGLIGWHFRNALNVDAVAYLRIASYYARGNWDLAVSGYWGPLLSWLMALFLNLGLPALAAARGVMALSAVVFFWGCVAVYRAFDLPEKWVITGAALAALASLYWSVQLITPDLLVSGLICLAVSRMLASDWLKTTPTPLGAGLLWGLAYLTKAVAFPLAILATLTFGGLTLRGKSLERRLLLRNMALTLLVFGLIASPWVLALSLKYRTPTISTTARISHTLTGPPDADRYHPFARMFHRPEPGRITSWEEPSRMAYKYWSPFERPEYTRHQFKVITRNGFTFLALLTSLNLAWLVLPFTLALQWMRKESRLVASWSCGQALVLPALLGITYLPFHVTFTEQRLFYSAFPFLASALALRAISGHETRAQRPWCMSEASGWWLTVLGTAAPLLAAVLVIGDSPKFAGDCAVELARRIERANLAGPVAGSGMLPGGRAGLYVAFLLDQPWHGDERHPTPASLKTADARLVVVIRHSELGAAMDQDPAFVDLDGQLFADAAESARFPLKVYEINGENREKPLGTANDTGR